jgi:hypothetical protein
LESAEIIQKLAAISQELVRDSYHVVQQRIARKYEEIEELLAKEFERTTDRKRLREIARILAEFKCFTRCVDSFVERAQTGAFRSGNVFEDIRHICEKTKPLIDEIFNPNPQQVMNKLILNVFYGKLQVFYLVVYGFEHTICLGDSQRKVARSRKRARTLLKQHQ